MFFDIGWPELMLIGAVALVVIGPKDLPAALRVAGFWLRKARMLSREFQSSVEQMIRDAELDEMRQELKKATEFDIHKEFQNTIDPTGELAESVKPPEIPDFFETTPAAAEPALIEAPYDAGPPAQADGAAAAEADTETPILPGLDTAAAGAAAEVDTPVLPGLELPPAGEREAPKP